jgi:chromosome segregation protein
VHLKTLTVRGFKSFATATTFRLEPGITCVVGPNGSGKSNVVDAIAWVLGEQGAKALRGGSMSDVIFAGTPGRPALGRAEVTLTIDNSDGALPVEYTEVSISRLMFRSGESEYSINGTTCRLLDVQELMSDSGIGRELHVIVGQGQLDAVLQARPEDRRAFVEEAAGVLKHRKRKEKALRKLDAMAANMARVTDLTAELRRQLGPLGRQAEIARRAGTIQVVVRDARLRLLADDLQSLRSDFHAEVADEQAAHAQRDAAERQLAAATAEEARLEAQAAAASPAVTAAQENHYRLSALAERSRGLQQLARERTRHLTVPQQAPSGRDPAQIEAEAASIRDEQRQTDAALEQARQRLDELVQVRQQAEARLTAAEAALAAATRAAADRREGMARLSGEVAAAESRVAAGVEEIGRLGRALEQATARANSAEDELESLQRSAGELDEGEVNLDTEHEEAARRAVQLTEQVEALAAAEREHERVRDAATARWEALALALDRRDGAGALLAAGLPGVLGSVASLITVDPGAQTAVAAALGAYAEAVAVADAATAVLAMTRLKEQDEGRVGLALTGAPSPPARSGPPAGRWALDLVGCASELRGALALALDGVVVVDDLGAAADVVGHDPSLRAVTREGDLLGAGWAAGGSAAAPSLLEVQAAADDARERAEAAGRSVEAVRSELTQVRAAQDAALAAEQVALDALHASDARMSALAEQLGLLGAQARGARAEADRLAQQRREAEAAQEADVIAAAALRERLAAAQAAPATDSVVDPAQRDAAVQEVAQARASEVEARLGVRTGEERVRSLASRAEQLERSAAAERAARERFVVETARRADAAAAAGEVAAVAAGLVAAAESAHREAALVRDEATERRTEVEGGLLAARAEVRRLTDVVAQLRDAAHRDEVARAEYRLRVEALEQKALEEYGIGADDLIAQYGPDQDVPPDPDAGPDVHPVPYDRAVQTKRAQAAERQLAQLGRVNPLALEEFTALEERHQFLATQLEDLKSTRRDLLGIVSEVDGHIHEIFRAAYEDTAREFEEVFAILFPGGTGRLELTQPDNLMETGIEVIARPAGKKVSRLSLLSGGERSLAAIALLVSIFRARPSPFYVLDEVEAALDDRNLQRLLECLEALRERSQLVIITHQKRTMEIADALYGVSMRGDGVSTVISQRLREAEPA